MRVFLSYASEDRNQAEAIYLSLRGDVRNPKGPEVGKANVIRGGEWYDPPDRLKSSWRMQADPATWPTISDFVALKTLPGNGCCEHPSVGFAPSV